MDGWKDRQTARERVKNLKTQRDRETKREIGRERERESSRAASVRILMVTVVLGPLSLALAHRKR